MDQGAAERPPGLLLCAHGTRVAAGAAVVANVADHLASSLPEVDVRLAFVDVQEPGVAEALSQYPDEQPVVLVPLLLSWGYHVEADVRAAAVARPATVATFPLGPEPRLARVLARRLADAGVPQDLPVVLAASGSSQARATSDVEAARVQLAGLRRGPVTLGYASAQHPSVHEAVRTLRSRGEAEVAVASYLLAPGHFHGVLRACGADVVSEPIGCAPEVIEIVHQRYLEGLGLLGGASGRRA